MIGGQQFRISDVEGGTGKLACDHYPKTLIQIVFDRECCESSRNAPTATAGSGSLKKDFLSTMVF